MVYLITKKEEEIASEKLYGQGATRYRFQLQTNQINGEMDYHTSMLTVSKEIFDGFKVGDSMVLTPFRYVPSAVDISVTADA
jgi:hypothetical protein